MNPYTLLADQVTRPSTARKTNGVIRAVVFDFDDVILMTGMPWFRACRRLWRNLGRELSVQRWNAIGEQQPDVVGAALARDFPHISKTQSGELLAAVISEATANISLETVAPGVMNFMRSAANKGVATGIASNASRSWVEQWLPAEVRERLAPRAIVTGNDVSPSRLKPEPDLYLKACSRLGVAPSDALGIEDTPIGAQAVLAAGMNCLVIPTEVTAVMAFPDGVQRAGSLEVASLDYVSSYFTTQAEPTPHAALRDWTLSQRCLAPAHS